MAVAILGFFDLLKTIDANNKTFGIFGASGKDPEIRSESSRNY